MPSNGTVFTESRNVKNIERIGSSISFRQCSYICMKELSRRRHHRNRSRSRRRRHYHHHHHYRRRRRLRPLAATGV
jgi:hypothetical protein